MPTLYYIRIPLHEDRVKAVPVLMEVPDARHRYPGNIMAVSLAHIEALEKANIPFEMASGRKWNGKPTAPVQP